MAVESKDVVESKIVFIDNYTFEASHIFNGNAFGDDLRENVDACATRMAIFRHSILDVCEQVSKDFGIFEGLLKKNMVDLSNAAIQRPDMNFVCYHDNTHYIAAMCSSLIYLKSFLDMYAILIVKSINTSQSLLFSKSRIDEESEIISGGKIINFLRSSAPAQYIELSGIILQHSKDWIGLAVKYRDTLTHYGDLRDLRRMRVPLRPKNPPFSAKNIEPPKMPHGDDVIRYVQYLDTKVHQFLEETLPMIPNVKLGLVDFREFPLNTN